MMEFESPRTRVQLQHHHPYEYAAENQPLDAQSSNNWPLAASNLTPEDIFATMDQAAYEERFEGLKVEEGVYTEQVGAGQNGWVMNGGVGFGGAGQTTMAQNRNANEVAGNMNMAAYSTMLMGLGNTNMQDASGGLSSMSNLDGGFVDASSNPAFHNQELWQQQSYEDANTRMPFENSMAGNNSLGIYAPGFDQMKDETMFALSITELPTENSMENLSKPVERNFAREWQNEEIDQIGYGKNMMDGSHLLQPIPVVNVPITTLTSTASIPASSGLQPAGTPDIIEELFPEVAPPTPSFALSPAPTDYQPHSHSRKVSAGGASWASPRTPMSWGPYSSPSPANHNVMIAGEEMFGSGQFEFMGPMNSPAMPPLDQLTGNFDTNPKRQGSKRKRKAFSTEGKQKVNSVRDAKACVACHVRKVGCEPGIDACPSCLKTAGDNPSLANEICIRTKLKETFVSVKVLHDTLDKRKQNLVPLLASLTGEPITVDLTVANTRLRYMFQLHLKVMRCESSPVCYWKRLAKVKGIYITQDKITDQRYVILPETLPTADQFDIFGRKLLSFSNGSHSGHLTRDIDDFLLKYCESNLNTQLHRFANATLRVASLNRLVAYGFLNLYDGSYDLLDRATGTPLGEDSHRRFVSETVHDQLRLLAAEGLESIESIIFGQVDNLQKLMSSGRNGRLVAGICILRMMLIYRDRVIRDSIRLTLPEGGKRHQDRLEKASFMYNRLTVVYGSLCRETTPLTMNWVHDNELTPSLEDMMLQSLFLQLQDAFVSFCNNKLTPTHDDLLRKLIIEAPKIERRPSKRSKLQRKPA